jgi:glycerate 2-kinase
MIRIVVAIDSFKGSLSSLQAGCAVADGLRAGWPGTAPDICIVPIADGGEGTVESLATALGGEIRTVTCRDPLGHPVEAGYLLRPDGAGAVLETAAACGLPLVEGRQDILGSDTRGLGEQILHALDAGARHLLIGLGGSATNDGGAGMLRALGVRFRDADGRELGSTPRELASVARVDLSNLDPRISGTVIEAICDVTNPLTGPHGASAIYGPQKGASPEHVRILDALLGRFAAAVESAVGRPGRDLPGAGAAGGLGFALAMVLGARLRPGIDVVMDACGLGQTLSKADLAITGEGRLDMQSLNGKAPAGVATRAEAAGVPCIAFCGSLMAERALLCPKPFAAIHEILPRAASLADAIARGGELLTLVANEQAAALSHLVEHQPDQR